MKRQDTKEYGYALENLRKYLPIGGTVYYHCDRWHNGNGLYNVYAVHEGDIVRLTWSAAKLLGARYNRGSETMSYSYGSNLCHDIGSILYPNGGIIPEDMPLPSDCMDTERRVYHGTYCLKGREI